MVRNYMCSIVVGCFTHFFARGSGLKFHREGDTHIIPAKVGEEFAVGMEWIGVLTVLLPYPQLWEPLSDHKKKETPWRSSAQPVRANTLGSCAVNSSSSSIIPPPSTGWGRLASARMPSPTSSTGRSSPFFIRNQVISIHPLCLGSNTCPYPEFEMHTLNLGGMINNIGILISSVGESFNGSN